MTQFNAPRVVSVFGTMYLILSIIAVLMIGDKGVRLALAAGGVGIAAWLVSFYMITGKLPNWIGFLLMFASGIIFGQRAIANFLAIIGIIQHDMSFDAYNKCISIVLLMCMTFTSISSLILLYTVSPPESPENL
jgi:hypothetical protein